MPEETALALLEKVKLALRLTRPDYDEELTGYINSAIVDLGIAGVVLPGEDDSIVETAIITYCKLHFSALSDGEYDRLKRSYDEQKAQLVSATGYTDWSGKGIVYNTLNFRVQKDGEDA